MPDPEMRRVAPLVFVAAMLLGSARLARWANEGRVDYAILWAVLCLDIVLIAWVVRRETGRRP